MYKMKYPKCGKRAFDISAISEVPIIVELKCPNCRNIVKVPCTPKMCIKNNHTEQRN